VNLTRNSVWECWSANWTQSSLSTAVDPQILLLDVEPVVELCGRIEDEPLAQVAAIESERLCCLRQWGAVEDTRCPRSERGDIGGDAR